MKTNVSFSTLIAVLLGMVACVMTSCSGEGGDSKLFAYVPDNAEAVLGIDVKAIAENAGCNVSGAGIELSPALTKLIGDDPRTLSILKAEGLDLNRVIVLTEDIKNVGEDMFIVANVNDASKLDAYLTNNGLKKSSQDGMDVYTYQDYCTVLVEDGVALYVPTGENGVQTARQLRNDAVKNPVASWKVDFLHSSALSVLADFESYLKTADRSALAGVDKMIKAIGIDDPKDLLIAMKTDVKNTELQYSSKMLDKNGNKINLDIEVGDLNKSLLKYTDAVDCFALLSALPSSDFVTKIVDAAGVSASQKAAFLSGYAYFKSVMIAGGPLDITKYWDTNSWHLVIAAEMQEGKAQEVFNILKSFLPSFGVPTNSSADDISFRMPGKLEGYVKRDGDNLVAAINVPVSADGSSLIKASDFGSYPAEMVVKIPAHTAKNTYLDLPFGVDFKSYSEDSETITKLKLTDAQGGLLQNIIEVAASHK